MNRRKNLDIRGKTGIFNILGSQVNITTLKHSIETIEQLIDRDRCSYICVSNTHVIVNAVKNPSYQEIINHADWNLPDGMPLVWYANMICGVSAIERVTGPTFMEKCLSKFRDRKHYFYGTTQDTLKLIRKKAQAKFPGIRLVGSHAPAFGPIGFVERKEIIREINRLNPDMIWIALGAPKQETFMWKVRNEIQRGVLIGVGAGFDYFAGNIKRPPKWLQRVGLEWLGRFIQEPKRLGPRYLITNCLFFYHIIKQSSRGS